MVTNPDTSDAWLGSAGALLQPSDQLAGGEEEGGYGHKLDAREMPMGWSSSSSSGRSRPHRDSSDEEEEGEERLFFLPVCDVCAPCFFRSVLSCRLLRLAVCLVGSNAPAPCGVVVAGSVIRAPVTVSQRAFTGGGAPRRGEARGDSRRGEASRVGQAGGRSGPQWSDTRRGARARRRELLREGGGRGGKGRRSSADRATLWTHERRGHCAKG